MLIWGYLVCVKLKSNKTERATLYADKILKTRRAMRSLLSWGGGQYVRFTNPRPKLFLSLRKENGQNM
jgi:hypothetical protein